MGIIGIEEIFLDVKDLAQSVSFYNEIIGVPIAKQDKQRVYLQLEQSHVVLQLPGSGRHRGGGPMHFAFTVTEDTFDEVVARAVGAQIFTRGPMGEEGVGRTLFIMDPDGNEAEVNTRYLYGVPRR